MTPANTVRTPTILLALAMSACGSSELTRLETEQRALELEVSTLRQTIDDLRGEMQRKGVIKGGPGGPRPKAAGAVSPDNDLAEDFPLDVTRSEATLAVAFVSDPEPRDDTACGWRVGLHHLESIADFPLAADGVGRASPVIASIGGKPLAAHATPADYADACSGAFRHQSKYLFYSPPEGVDGGGIEVRLADEMPFPDEDGRPRYWIYPGTTLTIQSPEGWNEAEWGPPHFVYDLALRDVGLPSKPNARSAGAVTITLPDAELSGRDASWRDSSPLTGEGPWSITISSPADGPFVLIDALAIGNQGHAAVLSSKQHDGGGE